MGHVVFDQRWGLQIKLLRLAIRHEPTFAPSTDDRPRPNGDLVVRLEIRIVGLSHHPAATMRSPTSNPYSLLRRRDHSEACVGDRNACSGSHCPSARSPDPRPAVTLLVRGGGLASDFAVYDDSLVGIAIDRHRQPVVTGLGHATDTTLADRAAHTACITPTAAAQSSCGQADRMTMAIE